MGGQVHRRTVDRVAILEIDNPPVNVLSQDVRRALADALMRADSESEIGAIVIAARGATTAALRRHDIPAARAALATSPTDPAPAIAALNAYAARPDKKPWLGGLLGLVPGLGYAYSGEYANATRSLILNSLFLWGMIETADDDQWAAFTVLTFVEFTWYSGSIYGGLDAAHRHNQRRLDAAITDIRGTPRAQPDFSKLPILVWQFEF